MKFLLTGALWMTAGSLAAAASAPQDPVIELTPSSVSVGIPLGGPDPSPQTLVLKNAGGKKMKWSATTSVPWLSVSPSSGELNKNQTQDLSVEIAGASLPIGDHSGTVVVQSNEATNSPQSSTISLRVNGVPALTLSPTTLPFSAPVGGPNPPAQKFRVENSGTGAMAWTATSGNPWISFNPTNGNLSAGGSEDVTVSVNVAGLPAGPQTGSISVAAPGASGTPKSVSVPLSVNLQPSIGLSPKSVSFDAPVNGANPAPKGFTVTNQGGGVLSWSAASTAPSWMSVSPTSGTLAAGVSASVMISVNTTGLVADTYTAQVNVSATGATNSPQAVAVTLNVNGQPKIGLNPDTLTFSGGGAIPPGGVSISNTGAGTLHWTLSGGASWLSAGSSSGTLAPLASQPVLISANATGLDPGTYRATLQVQDSGASNSPQTIAVTLNVPVPSSPTHAPAGHCGATGLELLLPFLLLRALRRRR